MTVINKKINLKIDPFYLIIATLVLLFLFIGKGIYYGNIGIDSWMYFGYYVDYPLYLKLFPYEAVYYHGRLSHILPGFVLFKLFSASIAGIILHMAFMFVCISFFYALIKNFLDSKTAIVISITMIFYPHFILCFSDDYPAFSAITYMLIAAFFLCSAYYHINSKNHDMHLILAGIFGALMIHSQLLTVIYTSGFFAGLYIIYYLKNGFSKIWKDFLFCAGGFLLITLMLCITNYSAGGDLLFFMRTIQTNPISSSATASHWAGVLKSRYFWTFNMTYIVFCLVSLVFILKYRKTLSDFKLAIYIGGIINACIVLFFSLKIDLVFAMDFNIALLIPQFFLIFSCFISDHIKRLSLKSYIYFILLLLILSVFSSILTPFKISNILDNMFPLFPDNIYISKLLIYNSILLVFIIPFLFFPRTTTLFLIPVAILFLNLGKVKYMGHLNKDKYVEVIKMHETFKKFDPSGYTFIWTDINNNIPAMKLTSIYLYNYRSAGYKFPEIGYFSLGGSSENTVFANQNIGIVIKKGENFSETDILNAARNNLKKYNLDFDLIDKFTKEGLDTQQFYFIRLKNLYIPSEHSMIELFNCSKDEVKNKFIIGGYFKGVNKIPFLKNIFSHVIDKKNGLPYYSPQIVNNELYTDYIKIPEHTNETDTYLILEVDYDNLNIPSDTLDIRLQAKAKDPFCDILGRNIFIANKNKYLQAIKIPSNIDNVRLILSSRNAAATFLPLNVKLGVAFIDKSHNLEKKGF